jgi:exodeoxyribonuclease VII large subunit
LAGRLPELVARRLGLAGGELSTAAASLVALGPGATLERGYAIVRRTTDGVVVRDPDEAAAGTGLLIRVSRGEFPARAGDS